MSVKNGILILCSAFKIGSRIIRWFGF